MPECNGEAVPAALANCQPLATNHWIVPSQMGSKPKGNGDDTIGPKGTGDSVQVRAGPCKSVQVRVGPIPMRRLSRKALVTI
jgi:hypothetical protein